MADDAYSRVDYRRFVAWPERIRREAPFLKQVLEAAPERSVIDLGCGTGEHSRFLAGEGFRVLGIDRSESMLEKAHEAPTLPNLKFVLGAIEDVERQISDRFGAAICLGNTLVHIQEHERLSRALNGIAAVLEPGGIFVFQILNYERIFERGIRHLPLNFQRDGSGEVVFLRLMELLEDKRVRFCPTTLRFDAQRESPVEVVRSRRVELRGWTREDLTPLLDQVRLETVSVHGDMQGGSFEPLESQDLVMVTRLSD